MKTKLPISVTISRQFQVSPERLFDAFFDPSKAGKFMFATATGKSVRAEIDARVGGKYLFVDRRGKEDVEHTGEYLKILRPSLIIFTLQVEKYSDKIDRVTIEISKKSTGCELVLKHELSPSLDTTVKKVKGGWAEVLDLAAGAVEDPAAKIVL